MTDTPSLMKFPCQFTLKIVGRKAGAFAQSVPQIVERHYPGRHDYSAQSSKNDTYLSLSVTVDARGQSELDALYQELSAHPDILMVL